MMGNSVAGVATKAKTPVVLSYSGPPGRDKRIDIIRGASVVVLGIHLIVQVLRVSAEPFEATGTISALAFIVVTEGALIGMLYRPRVASGILGEAILRLLRRARGWYLAGVVLSVGMLLISLVPYIETSAVTAFAVDRGNRINLFPPPTLQSGDVTLSYPVDPAIILDVIALRFGPWPFDVVAVLAVLFLVAPLGLWALSKGKWLGLLLVSFALYVVELFSGLRILPTRGESDLPVLGWQFVFFTGMIAGHYRRELVRWFSRPLGRTIFIVLAVASIAWTALPLIVEAQTPGAFPDLLATWTGSQTSWLFDPSSPGPTRFTVSLIILFVAYGALSAFWRPIGVVLGPLVAPIGEHILLSLVLLVIGAIFVSNISASFGGLAPELIGLIVLAAIRLIVLLVDVIQRRKTHDTISAAAARRADA